MLTVKYCLYSSENSFSSVSYGVFSTKLQSLEKGILVWKTFRKASAAMLHRNYWKIINFLISMPNAGRCLFAGGDVEPNPP